MREFFDNYFNVPKMMKEKREYKEQMVRVGALPEAYRFVFDKIQSNIWMFATGSGYDMLKIQYNLIDLFEAGAKEGKSVLEITGEDVAAFCETLLKNAGICVEDWRTKLNREVAEKFGK